MSGWLAVVNLENVGEVSTLGDYPRSFTSDPTGNFLVWCNQRSDARTTFRIRAANGEGEELANSLVFTDQYTPVGSPAIIVFLTWQTAISD